MSRLEDLQPTAAVRGILPDQVFTVVSVQWFGSEDLELTYKGPTGRVANELLYRHDESRLQVVEHGRWPPKLGHLKCKKRRPKTLSILGT